MRSNGLLKWLMIPMALLVVFVGFKLFSGGGSQTSGDGGPQLTPEEARALGIEGDTPRDTVATLVGLVRQLRGELQTALGDNRTQKAENERLRAREGSIDRRIQSALENERNLMRQDREQVAGERQRTQGMLQDLQRRIEGLKDGELPVGLGLDGESADGVRWVEPDDARREKRSGVTGDSFSFPTSFGPAQGLLGGDETSTGDNRTTTAPSAKPGLYRADQLHPDGIDRHDGADRSRADRRHRQRPLPVQGADRSRQSDRQWHRHSRRRRRGGQRHRLR